MRYKTLLITTILSLSACTVGPDYQKPARELPADFVAADVLQALNVDNANKGVLPLWWQGFHDPVLNDLVESGIGKNFEIAGAYARVKSAKAEVQLAGADARPTVDVDINGGADASRDLRPNRDNDTETSMSGAVGIGVPLDVFGATRRAVEAAEYAYIRAQDELKGAVLDVSAEITAEYLGLRGQQRQLALLNQSIALQEKTLDIVRARYESGLAPELDLQRAVASVQSLKASVPPLLEDLQNKRNRLAVLTGRFPGYYEALLSEEGGIPVYQAAIPTLMPLAVVNARPDVRAAEGRLKEATANIGVAEAAYYPSFSLSQSLRIGLTDVSSVPVAQNLVASFAALITHALSDGGARGARMDVAKAEAEEALADYDLTLREAVEDVELSLNAIKSSSDRQQYLANSVAASARSFHQAQTLYQQGLISFLDVVDAQQDLASDEQRLASEQTDYATEIANLFKVLGADVPVKAQ